jgi:cardiolipin synthase A/B
VLEGLLGIPATAGNRIDVLRNGDEIFPAMLQAIEEAERSIDFLTFIYWTGQIAEDFADALAKRAAAGVRVRVLLDGVGARLMDKGLADRMTEAGAEVQWFRPPVQWRVWQVEHRTHRKVLVCDERVGFTGGVGIAEEWCGDARHPGEWRDTHFRVRGPAVDGLRGAFIGNWLETGQALFDEDEFADVEPAGEACVQVVRGGAGVGWSDIAILLRALVQLAEHRVRITTAYFTPDKTFIRLLCEAVERGVQVQVLTPGPHADKRIVQLASEADYEALLDAGVELWNYQPTMLHAKVVTVDDAVACVGSSNINSRSMARDDEVSMVLFDPELTAVLDGHADEDLEASVRIEEARWAHRSLPQKVLETATRVMRPRL